jgi:integrase
MASIRKKTNPNGQVIWQSRWREPGPNGKDRQRTKNFPNARDAKAYAAKVEQEVERRGVGDPDRQTTAKFLHGWIALLEQRGEHSPSTIDGYRRNVGLAEREIGAIPLAKLSAADLDRGYARLLKSGGTVPAGPRPKGERKPRPLKARTVLHVHRVMHTALEQARKWKLIGENPARDATAPSPAKAPVRAFTAAEVQRLLSAAAGDRIMTTVISLLLVTGIRRSELLGLAWDAVDLDAGTITIRRAVIQVKNVPVLREQPKTEAGWRVIGLSAGVVDLLRRQKAHVLETALAWGKGYQREPFFCFPSWGGAPMLPMDMTIRLRQVMRQAKVADRQPTHGWRHTSATLLIHSGENVKTVQTRLGHSTPAITMALYVHPTEEADRSAAEFLGSLLPPAKPPAQ